MQTRRLGRTDHLSSIIAFGSYALFQASPYESDKAIASALENGINHFDVSPIYGQAENRIGSWIKRHGQNFFLGCKTHERTKESAWESLKRSLDALRVDCFDLFQLHGVDDKMILEKVIGPGGALEAILEARDQGLVRHIGITGHRPDIQMEALSNFNFDTVMFPLNRVHAAHPQEHNNFIPLLERARKKDIGVLAIKAIAKGLWQKPESSRRFQTWYEPFETQNDLQDSLWFTLSQDIHSAVLPGDLRLWPTMIKAAQEFLPLESSVLESIISRSISYVPLEGPQMD